MRYTAPILLGLVALLAFVCDSPRPLIAFALGFVVTHVVLRRIAAARQRHEWDAMHQRAKEKGAR